EDRAVFCGQQRIATCGGGKKLYFNWWISRRVQGLSGLFEWILFRLTIVLHHGLDASNDVDEESQGDRQTNAHDNQRHFDVSRHVSWPPSADGPRSVETR